ncbi:Protein kinase domain-containing protein [Lasiodiplodia theobromae]|uniref:Protein kinase domain-containing protein n=1 Tax=Lasiodiplodia theobromae TaxID=45133 RepID=UPI0015C364CD|nr:Protein kinase domain-containing protein [Lasiodiplodia theobromae]KAF4536841.1 Protein kinase domain-containing protein [Lasiodiplodia theobromae]
MDILQQLRCRIRAAKVDAAGQVGRCFIPEGSIEGLLPRDDIATALQKEDFQIPFHKRQTTADLIVEEGRLIFAILLETNLEFKLPHLLEQRVTDKRLPLDESRSRQIFEENASHFFNNQWSFLPYKFRRFAFHNQLQKEEVLPYIEENQIGGGGFSTVYKVRIHPKQDELHESSPASGYRIRKRLDVRSIKGPKIEESELLFLLGALEHRNIVKLLAAYTQDGTPSLIFEPADCDLRDLLKMERRLPVFAQDSSIFKALHGLASGIKHLHNFSLISMMQQSPSDMPPRKGCHYDLKPANVLVRGADFVLADFGLSRLKPLDEDSKTPFRGATREYGAPECEDPETFEKGMIGRASDIWSLACIMLEVLTYVEKGSKGVECFRGARVYQGTYGKLSAFHKDRQEHPAAEEQVTLLRTTSGREPPLLDTYSFLRNMLSLDPEARPLAEAVQMQLSKAALQVILGEILQILSDHVETSRNPEHTWVFRARLQLELNRLRAWSGTGGLLRLETGFEHTQRIEISQFEDVFAYFKTTIAALPRAEGSSASKSMLQDREDCVIASLYQLNNHLYTVLSNEQKIMADSLFASLITATDDNNVLVGIKNAAGHTSTPQYENAGALAAMKYMAILYSKGQDVPGPTARLDPALFTPDGDSDAEHIRPRPYWYDYDLGQRRKVHVELIGYGKKWTKDVNSEDFKRNGEAIFSRIQKLAALMRDNPRPEEFCALKCIGAYHNAQDRCFGIVHEVPQQNQYSVRLRHLLKDRKAKVRARQPDMDEKCRLAYKLVSSVNKLHLSGWLHKAINSSNVIFVHPSRDSWEGLGYDEPYIIGFDHSREDELNAYTEGPSENMKTEYQHPLYQSGTVPFCKAFDRYSLGLLLLEIGLWAPISMIYSERSEASPDDLSKTYMRYCEEKLPKMMPKKYSNAARKCLALGFERENPMEADQTFHQQVIGNLAALLD